MYCDTSRDGLSCILMQLDKVIAYGSCQLKMREQNYLTHDLELGRYICFEKLEALLVRRAV